MRGSWLSRSASLFAVLIAGSSCGGGTTDPTPTPPPADPVLVTTTGPNPTHLELSQGTLFWSQGGELPIQSLAIAGGTPTPLAHKIGAPAGLALSGPDVFWLDDREGVSPIGCVGLGAVRVLRKGPTELLATGDQCYQTTGDLVISAGDVHWVTSTNRPADAIQKTSRAGGGTTTVVTLEPPAEVVAMLGDGGYVYWLEGTFPDPGNAIRRMPLSGGPVETLVSGFMSEVRTFAVNSEFLFYCVYVAEALENLYAVPLGGGSPILLGSTGTRPLKLKADESKVYWFDPAAVSSMPIGGGAPAVLANLNNDVFDLLLRSNDVLWAEATGSLLPRSGTIKSVPKTGGAAAVLGQTEDAPDRLAANASWIYWSEGGSTALPEGYGRIARVPASGGAAATVVSGVSRESAPISVTDNYVFIADRARIKRVPRAGGTVETVAANLNRAESLVADAASVYWLELPISNVRKASVMGGPITDLASSGLHGGLSGPIHLQGGKLYWMTHNDAILSVATAGGPVGVVASNLPYLSDFVMDATGIYWSENDTGALKRIPLTGGQATYLGLGLGFSWNMLAVDDSHLYWIEQLHLGKVPKIGGTSDWLVPDLVSDPFVRPGIAADDNHVYFTAPLFQALLKVQK